MPETNIILPSKPHVVSEDNVKGVYEIEGLYPGYGHTLGNSLRRIILSSLPGAAITSLKIDGVSHEFSTVPGVKEDVLTIILNLKKVRFKLLTDEPQKVTLSARGAKKATAGDFECPAGVEVANADQFVAELTDKSSTLTIECTIERGLGYLPREQHQKERVDVGVVAIDAIFTPVRRVNYDVENMRVGNRTDFNRLRITIETDGTVSPREALENSIAIMIHQLKAVVGFKEHEPEVSDSSKEEYESSSDEGEEGGDGTRPTPDALKTRIEDLNLSVRTLKALSGASIRTVGGLVRKTEEDLLSIDGLGVRGVTEIKRVLSNFGLTLK
jgi:DNA-directed RNA polymerase subunit alpha